MIFKYDYLRFIAFCLMCSQYVMVSLLANLIRSRGLCRMKTKRGESLKGIPSKDLNNTDDSYIDDFDDKYYKAYVKQEINLNRIRIAFLLVVIMVIVVKLGVYVAESNIKLEETRKSVAETPVGVNQDISPVERVASSEVVTDSGLLVDISCVLGEYSSILKTGTEFSRLNNLCIDNSKLFQKEQGYRSSMQYAGDEFDCSARALRDLSTFVSIGKINEVRAKDGVYYCYTEVSMPDVNSLWEYYLMYAYDITRFVSTRDLDTETLTSCMTYILQNKDLPLVTKEVEFQLVNKEGVYYLVDDSVFETEIMAAYDKTIDCMVDLLGTRLSPEAIN